MSFHAHFRTLIEDALGALWQAQFQSLWPGYQA